MTPRSWEDWIAHYEAKGYRVLAPAYPGFEVEVEALNADPAPIEALTVPQIVEHLEAVVGELDAPPILIGHSAGGVFTQILLDHGFGAVGVAINSAPDRGRRAVPLSQIKATFPVLKNPANRHNAVGFTHEQWHYAFTNTFSEEGSRALYERYHIPASGAIFWGSALANIHPGHDDNWVNYKNDDRAPLLFISGSDGQPHAAVASSVERQALQVRDTITEVKEFEGPHLLPAREGWEEVADYALDWAVEHARASAAAPHERRPHHPHRRADGADRGRRLAAADRSDVRPPRPAGTASAGARARASWPGPAIAAADLGPIDAVLLSHDHHDDNLDPAGRALLPVGGRRGHDGVGREAAGRRARGLEPWATTRLEAPGRPPIEVTATPCRHGPPLSHPIVGDVIGFALRWEGQEHGVLWISGDTVLYDGVREVAEPPAGRHRAPAPRRRAVPGHGPAALHDDRARRPSSCAGSSGRARRSRSTTRAGSTSGRAGTAIEREFAAAPAGDPRPRPLAADRRPDRARRLTPSILVLERGSRRHRAVALQCRACQRAKQTPGRLPPPSLGQVVDQTPERSC